MVRARTSPARSGSTTSRARRVTAGRSSGRAFSAVANDGYYDAQWRKLVRFVLARDNRVCRIRLPGCTIVATTGDHIVPRHRGGARLDPLNVRAACQHCNSVRGNLTRRDEELEFGHEGPSRDW